MVGFTVWAVTSTRRCSASVDACSEFTSILHASAETSKPSQTRSFTRSIWSVPVVPRSYSYTTRASVRTTNRCGPSCALCPVCSPHPTVNARQRPSGIRGALSLRAAPRRKTATAGTLRCLENALSLTNPTLPRAPRPASPPPPPPPPTRPRHRPARGACRRAHRLRGLPAASGGARRWPSTRR